MPSQPAPPASDGLAPSPWSAPPQVAGADGAAGSRASDRGSQVV